MPSPVDLARSNLLLARLPPSDLERVAQRGSIRTLELRDQLVSPGEPITEVAFPIDAIISLVAETAEGGSVEVGTIGRDGVAGVSVFLGSATTPMTMVCQVAGSALILPSADAAADEAGSPLHESALRYAHHLMVQASTTAVCNRLHQLEQRAARWLLTIMDRRPGAQFRLTHEYFALMLGAQRPSVTLVAQIFQRAGLISYRRGMMDILDREGLVAVACECHATVMDDYEKSFGVPLV